MAKTADKVEKFNLQQHITNQIIESLETGVKPWVQGWDNKAFHLHHIPVNLSSKKRYRGVNVLLLWAVAMNKGYKSRYWVTYKQATELGGTVRKGEKSSMVCYYSTMPKCKVHGKDKQDDCKACEHSVGFWKYYLAFNVEQCEGLEYPETPVIDDKTRDTESNAMAETILRNSGAKIEHRAVLDAPHYSHGLDKIVLPHQNQFRNDAAYYATALHELTHWTGHEKHLNRQFGKRFGDSAYAFEELVAELGSAFLCAEVGNVGTLDRHVSYIDNWLNVLKKDKSAIFTAASKASDAYEYCLAFSEAMEGVA
jgi:antirestriction protein ArdC